MLPIRSTALALMLGFGLGTCWTGGLEGAEGETPTAATETRRLLTVGWESGTSAKAAADESFAALAKLAPGDPDALYAYALVLMKQRRYTEAAQVLDRVLAAARDDLPALQARAWVAVIARQFGRGLVEVERAIALLPKENLDAAAESSVAETCRFLGRLVGYLEGPANDVAAANAAAAARERIATRLSETRLAAFYSGRQSVLHKFADFGSERERTEDENVAAAKEAADKTKADLERQREQNAAEVDRLKSDLERTRSDAERELADLDAQAPPLQSRLAAADAAAAQVQARIVNISNEIGRLQALLAREKDPFIRDRLQRDIDRLRLFRAQIDTQLIPIQREFNLAAGMLNQLAARRAAAAMRWENERIRLEKALAALRKSDTRIGAIERRLNDPPSGASPKTRALSAQALALTTYEAFPLEEEKQRLLAALD